MSITLNSVAYNWVGFDPSGTSRWTSTAGGVATAFSNLTARVTIGGYSDGKSMSPRMSKSKWRIQIPVIAAEDSECSCVGTVLRTAYVEVSADFHPAATLAERTDALARLRSLVLTTEFESSYLDLSQPAG